MSRVKSSRSRGRISKPPPIQTTPSLHRRPMLEFFQNIFASLETMLLVPSVFRTLSSARKNRIRNARRPNARPMEDLAQEVDSLFSGPINIQKMLSMSELMREQFREKLQAAPECMLPSFNHTLPSGTEKGTYLALDVGGSTFRVALVELMGAGSEEEKMRLIRLVSSPITDQVKRLPGVMFFDWMADKIEEMLADDAEKLAQDATPLPTGLAWSFPVEQTSMGSGKVQATGKGFVCFDSLQGQDLNSLITEACQRKNLRINLQAIINDGSATLLSRAYTDQSTRFSLILGTGTNAAVHLPVVAIGTSKFGTRPQSWHDQATHVIVNTELSMFGGKGVLPTTRWDDHLNRTHLLPDFQPLEYMITGRYLGEIVRLIIVEAVETTGLFNGQLPLTLQEPYSLDTSIVATISADDSPALSASSKFFQARHTFSTAPTTADLLFLKVVCSAVSRRAAAYLATAIHALWQLKNSAEVQAPQVDPIITSSPTTGLADSKIPSITTIPTLPRITIAYDGSVINKYPGFREMCQSYINQVIAYEVTAFTETGVNGLAGEALMANGGLAGDVVVLEPARDAAIFGAAVAVASLEDD